MEQEQASTRSRASAAEHRARKHRRRRSRFSGAAAPRPLRKQLDLGFSLFDVWIIWLDEVAGLELILVSVISCCVLKSFLFELVELDSSIFMDSFEILVELNETIAKPLWIVIENCEVFISKECRIQI